MNVFKTWNKGYTGSGITIAIVDDGVEFSHSDLAANYVSSYSYDFVVGVYNGDHKVRSEYHGTSCAGVAAAVKNTDCVIGAAYDASIASTVIFTLCLRVYGDRGYTTASEKAMALTYKLQNIDIYSNSWGPSDSGIYFFDMADVLVKAFEKGVTKGRGGLGAIYTWASGNGGSKHDDCNADGYAKSIYTIAVAAMSETTSYTRYSEKCSAILTAAYSGDYPNRRITTTSANGTCVNTFSGTSSACPVASGIIAQTLQANSFLTWRDIQHIIVETSVSSGLHSNIIVSTNGAGKKCTSMKLDFWQLTFHGTVTNPLSGTPVVCSTFFAAGTLGGACSTSDDCRSVTNGGCLLDVKICVECNKNNNSVNSFCAKDGETGGYCNSFIPCLSLNGECINNVCRPKVPKDGETGGYCNSFIPCLSLNGECINNVCRPKVPKDGETGGYCNSFIPCLSLNGECINNVCRPNVPKDESSSDNTGVIAGAVVGSVVGVILIACGIYCMYKKSAPPRRVSPVSDGLQQERQQQQRLQQQQQQYTHSSDSSQPSFSHGGAHPIHQL
ncbi:Proprotein convertase subtilisin kexin type [Mactra antiquata]